MASLNTTSCAAFNGSLVIGDVFKTVSGSPDGVPKLSNCVEAGIVGAPAKTPITALVEFRSTLGGFVVPRMTTAQQAAMPAGTVPDGTIVYLTDGANFSLRVNNAWVAPGVAAGEIIGPGVTTQNAVATWNNLVGTSLQNTNLLYAAGVLSGMTGITAGGVNANLAFTTNGTGGYTFSGGNGLLLNIDNAGGAIVNSFFLKPSITGNAVQLTIQGDANQNLIINGNGTGGVMTSNYFAAAGGLRVTEAANSKQGVATLVAGTVVVANTSITAVSRIFLTAQDANTAGSLRVSARVAGTSFTILSSNNADTGVIAYEIFEPA
jgi:hypothetical protein